MVSARRESRSFCTIDRRREREREGKRARESGDLRHGRRGRTGGSVPRSRAAGVLPTLAARPCWQGAASPHRPWSACPLHGPHPRPARAWRPPGAPRTRAWEACDSAFHAIPGCGGPSPSPAPPTLAPCPPNPPSFSPDPLLGVTSYRPAHVRAPAAHPLSVFVGLQNARSARSCLTSLLSHPHSLPLLRRPSSSSPRRPRPSRPCPPPRARRR